MASDGAIGGLPIAKINGLEASNHAKHHTAGYDTDALILRRGQSFVLSIELNREYLKEADEFYVVLEIGKKPGERGRTLIRVAKVDEFLKNEWGYKIIESSNKELLHIDVFIRADCIVSKYRLSIETVYKDGRKRKTASYDYSKDVYILFNAWCEDDEVYMKDKALRDEYVLNDTGSIYWGGNNPKYWNFAQFTDQVFRCSISLLEKNKIMLRDNARDVARVMSAMANDADDNGVVAGNWSGKYQGGRNPTEWQGSFLILKQYLETGEPVKFGQCWVFSGVLTSLMRALGIPTRCVTNYDSAHDSDSNLTFDKYFDEEGYYLDGQSDDSCWNFHVWNECWMSRPDLPLGYGGWQVIDSTPQEESNGIYRAGPASVQAIKEGKVNLSYDTKFIFAEVNADKVYWQKNRETEAFEAVKIETHVVGHNISTKAVGENDFQREDLTSNYKYSEESALERIAVRRALKMVKNPVVQDRPKDIKFHFDVPEELLIGTNVNVSINIQNTADKALSVDANVTAQIVRYNGVMLKKLEPQRELVQVSRKARSSLKFTFNRSEYTPYLEEHPMIRVTIMAGVQQTKQIYVSQKVIFLETPELALTLTGKSDKRVTAGEKIRVKVTLQLPDGVNKLTGCILSLEGSAIDGTLEFSVPDVKGSRTYSVERSVTIRRWIRERTNLQLLAHLKSKEFRALQGILLLECSPDFHESYGLFGGLYNPV